MEEKFVSVLIQGSIIDPILWILSFVIGSSLLIKNLKKIYAYLLLSGLIWGLIRLYVYKALGENLNLIESFQLIFVCIFIMLITGLIFYFIINLFKSKG